MSSTDADVRRLVRESKLLVSVKDDTFEKLMKVLTIVKVGAGETLYTQAEVGDAIYLLLRGNVSCFYNHQLVKALVPRDVGGMQNILAETHAHHRQSHIVDSIGDALIAKLKRDDFYRLMDIEDFRYSFVRFMRVELLHRDLLLSQRATSLDEQKTVTIAVYDTKSYDKTYFDQNFKDAKLPDGRSIKLRYLDVKLSKETAALAVNCRAVCIFVHDDASDVVLKRLKNFGVEYVMLRAAGFNNVDLAAAAGRGMAVVRVPAYSPFSVAEHAVSLMCSLNRHIPRAYDRTRNGDFTLDGLEGRDLHGLTCGIFGCGKIGQVFGRVAHGFGMKLLLWDPFPNEKYANEVNATYVKDKYEVLRQCDVITIHLPLNKDTKYFIDKKALDTLKKGAIVINTSRGEIVKSKDLLDALVSGHIGGAGMDVYEHEGPYFFEDRSTAPIKDPVLAHLVNLPNAIVTSHLAFFTTNALKAIADVTLKNTLEYFAEGKRGKDLTNFVPPPPTPKSKM